MKQTDIGYQKLTGEGNKHIRKRTGLKNCIIKREEPFLKNYLIS